MSWVIQYQITCDYRNADGDIPNDCHGSTDGQLSRAEAKEEAKEKHWLLKKGKAYCMYCKQFLGGVPL